MNLVFNDVNVSMMYDELRNPTKRNAGSYTQNWLFPFVTASLMESWTCAVTNAEKVFHNFHDVARFAVRGNRLAVN